MKANPNYREKVPYDKIHILFMGDASAKTMALQSGQVDLVENITNVSDIQNFQQTPITRWTLPPVYAAVSAG